MTRPTGRVSMVEVAGPLAPFADAYEAELSDRGYAPRTIVNQLRQVARLSRWLGASDRRHQPTRHQAGALPSTRHALGLPGRPVICRPPHRPNQS
jgi:hypothetical protein